MIDPFALGDDALEDGACAMCEDGGGGALPLFRVGCLGVVRCRSCGLVYTHPRVRREVVRQAYEAENYLNSEERETEFGLRCADRLAVIAPWLESGRLLDIGCGSGVFLGLVSADGRPGFGVEQSVHWAQFACQRHGIPVTAGDAERLPYGDRAFSTVTAWHVLEHLYRPRRALAEVHRVLAPGGVLVVECPNFAAPSNALKRRWLRACRHRGSRWRHLNPVEHLHHFTRPTLRRLVEACGFYVVVARTMSGPRNAGGAPPLHWCLQAVHAGNRLLLIARRRESESSAA